MKTTLKTTLKIESKQKKLPTKIVESLVFTVAG